MPPRLLTTGEIAERCDVHRTTVFYWVKNGKLTPSQTVNGIRLFDETDVDRFLAERAAA